MIGCGRSVDGAHRAAQSSIGVLELPSHEGPEPDDAVLDDCDPSRRLPEGILFVLPREEVAELRATFPAERGGEQVEDRGAVSGDGTTHVDCRDVAHDPITSR